MTRATQHRPTPTWFPCGTSRRLRGPDDGGGWTIEGTVHARQIGSATSACGRSAVNWPMLLDRPFGVLDPRKCAECTAVVSGAHRAGVDA